MKFFRADLFPAISANPFMSFFTTITESGKFEFEWVGDKGFSETASASIIGRMSLARTHSDMRACWRRRPLPPQKSRKTSAGPASAS